MTTRKGITREEVHSVSFSTVVLIVFVVLKLTGLITWSWWWVLSPFWIPLLVATFLMVIFGLAMVISACVLGSIEFLWGWWDARKKA